MGCPSAEWESFGLSAANGRVEKFPTFALASSFHLVSPQRSEGRLHYYLILSRLLIPSCFSCSSSLADSAIGSKTMPPYLRRWMASPVRLLGSPRSRHVSSASSSAKSVKFYLENVEFRKNPKMEYWTCMFKLKSTALAVKDLDITALETRLPILLRSEQSVVGGGKTKSSAYQG